MKKILMSPIGTIRSPYKKVKDMPIQGTFKPDIKAWVELKKEYIKGLEDLEGFSHTIIIYYFHKSERMEIKAKPFLEDKTHGIFAIRSPRRPNHIGLSVVKVECIKDNKLYFSEVDMLDRTPVLDIKPYIRYFDIRENVTSGWVDKHFENGNISDKTIVG